MTDAPAKAKPKRKVERYAFDEVAVELRQVDPDKREAAPGDFMSGPAQRSKWEVHIDGVHHGYVFYPLGVANPWIGCLLEPQDLTDFSDGEGVRCWLGPTGEHGGWEETGGKWDGLLGLLKKLEAPDDLKRRGSGGYGFPDRASAAEAFARAYRSGKVPDARRVDEKIAQARADRARRKREDEERKARYAREAIEERDRKAREAAAAEELRQEVLAGLASIEERFKGQLSNLEMAALTRAIERYTK